MTCISRKEVFDILDHFRQEQVTNENEDLLIRMLAKELLQLKTYEIDLEEEEVKKNGQKVLYILYINFCFIYRNLRTILGA